MARIEFNDVEVKMKDLRGYYKGSADPDKNPYRASELNDDDFNFLSGVNYALSHITDLFMANGDMFDKETPYASVNSFIEEIAKRTLQEYVNFGYYELEEMMTSFIDDSTDWDADEENEE